jgi:hypothetical protein
MFETTIDGKKENYDFAVSLGRCQPILLTRTLRFALLLFLPKRTRDQRPRLECLLARGAPSRPGQAVPPDTLGDERDAVVGRRG